MAGGAGRVVELTNPKYQLGAPGATFAGRDIFAPAAAHLCAGVPLTELGPLIDADLLMPATVPLPRLEDDRLIAEILWIDRYGNCQLNLGPDDLEAGTTTVQLRIGSPSDPGGVTLRSAKRSDTFADIGAGLGLVTDSYGMLAISLDRASAADELGVAAGDQVVIVAGEEPSGSSTPVQLGRR
jgi:S-adenosylmethionine hydrolase